MAQSGVPTRPTQQSRAAAANPNTAATIAAARRNLRDTNPNKPVATAPRRTKPKPRGTVPSTYLGSANL